MNIPQAHRAARLLHLVQTLAHAQLGPSSSIGYDLFAFAVFVQLSLRMEFRPREPKLRLHDEPLQMRPF